MNALRIFGDSHAARLRDAAQWRQGRPQRLEFFPCHGVNWMEFTMSQRDGRVHCAADRVAGTPALDFTFGPPQAPHFFSSPLHSAPVLRHEAWRRYRPWDLPAGEPALMPLSGAVLASWFDTLLHCRFVMLREVLRQGYRVAVVEPPRPLPQLPGLFNLRPEVVLAVDRHYRAHVRRWLAAEGVPVIEVPEASIGADGFTTPQYASPDPKDTHHGSLTFAGAMLDRILAFAAAG